MNQQNIGGGSGATNGMASSLAMTPISEMRLMNPDAAEKARLKIGQLHSQNGNKSYFSSMSGFDTVL